MLVRSYPAVTAFCCLFRVVLGLCVDVSPSLRFFSVISPFVVIFYILFDVKYSILCRVCRDAGYMRVYTGGRSVSVRAGRD